MAIVAVTLRRPDRALRDPSAESHSGFDDFCRSATDPAPVIGPELDGAYPIAVTTASH